MSNDIYLPDPTIDDACSQFVAFANTLAVLCSWVECSSTPVVRISATNKKLMRTESVTHTIAAEVKLPLAGFVPTWRIVRSTRPTLRQALEGLVAEVQAWMARGGA
jgi:hypothetical protein